MELAALILSGLMILISVPCAVIELRYEARRRRLRRIPTLPDPWVSGNQPATHLIRVTKLGDARRRTYAVSPYLGAVPPQIDALPAPDEVPEDQKL